MKTFASITVSAMALLLAAGATPAQAEGFSGFYAGLQLGVTDGDASSARSTSHGAALTTAQEDYKLSAISGGAHVGYTHQFDNLVVGGIFDIDLTDMNDSDSETSASDNADRNTLSFDTLYSLRAKGGWQALPGTLLYATAGYAWASADASVDFTTATSTSEGRSVTFSGFTYGAGVDFRMTDSATIGLEWKHLSLDDKRVTFVDSLNSYDLGFEPDLDTIQIRASYYFMPALTF
jgi:opacity protein-like surface antigen